MGFLDSKIKTLENGKQVIEMPNSVNFLILTKDCKIIMAKQWRASCNCETINLFGGYLDGNETYLQALERELKEETNLNLSDFVVETVYNNKIVSSGTSTERNSLFILVSDKTATQLLKDMNCNDIDEGISFNVRTLDNDLYDEIHTDSVDGLRSFVVITTYFLMMVHEVI